MRQSAKERIAKCLKEGLCAACLQPFKKGERVIRLNHVRCYHATRRAIQSGKTTEGGENSRWQAAEASNWR